MALAIPLVLVICSFQTDNPNIIKLKAESKRFLKHIPEPSDIVYDHATGHFFIVSDHGFLFECNKDGSIIRKASVRGLDFEGLELRDSLVYVSDESGRKVYLYKRSDLSLVKTYTVRWDGAINKAFESIIYNEARHCFVLIAEKPATVVEVNDSFKEVNRFSLGFAKDINGARYYKGQIYMVSSGGSCVYRCNPNNYRPDKKYLVKILNAEGVAFDDEGKMFITSDNEQKLYNYNSLPN